MIIKKLYLTSKWNVELHAAKQIALGAGFLWGDLRFYASICLGPFELSVERYG